MRAEGFDREAMTADLAALVSAESPSGDAAALAACREVVAELGGRLLGAAPTELGEHLRWGPERPRVLLLGHYDTVWPVGTLARRPFEVAGARATGPGCFDMKAGLVQLFHALGAVPGRADVGVLVTSDEETGSETSRELIESTARDAQAVLVAEPSAGGALKTSRKGLARYDLRIFGKAAHTGLDPERGVNAALELAHQIRAIAALAAPARGTTVTPSVCSAGTTVNTVPASAALAVDVRAYDAAELDRIDRWMRARRAVLPGARLEVHPGPRRGPLQRSASFGLFQQAVRAAEETGLPALREASVGGGSDGNLTAALGVPTLDGLGAVGGGAHADDEWVDLRALPDRAALLAALLRRLS
ncbi:M20/M25/M40 family metallo-hydrolase [Actinocorallia sp. A-T 12471]|uniref:M20/M25/M40 family metallo-hydrolase n=1 Tax=Actinocorallia sp. A-T 12471 TaxID=3089813 RepID=UPI0029CD30B2|nr:M20/M25/M40 family metallo-hydrolase [Actinocorallia sp. A-T 12471]MDX6743585.1 M20/M25/M40 family metallo-hydrolase [Actinocorallia sp. A-T 12471]